MVSMLTVINYVKRDALQKLLVVGVISVVFLGWGCASQSKRVAAPEPLVSDANLTESTESAASAPVVTTVARKAKPKPTKAVKPAKSVQTASPAKSATQAKSTDSAKGEKIVHTVKKGETLKRIAKNYGVPAKAICKANQLKDTKELEVGQKIVIPSAGKAASSASKATASGGKKGAVPRGFVWPVKGKVVSPFGEKKKGIKNVGIGILPQSGQNVVAAKKGVIEAVSATGGGKYTIVVKHEGGCRTFYEGCGKPVVGEKAKIGQGQPIAAIGGSAGKPQILIFKIYVKDKPINPASCLP